jgi:nucleotidyltransferase substrate binding protein (TIGR01987 family)
MIDYEKFQKALKHLELQNANYQNLNESLERLLQEAVAESVIQRFETCYDCLWKVLKRYLDEELGIPELPNSPKPLLRIASENKLFRAPIEDWLAYADARTDTAHDYSEEKMQAVLDLMPAFVEDAIGLFQTMTGNAWD